MNTNITTAAIALILSAGVAAADGVSAGQAQIANFLGVDAGRFNAAELGQLLAARNDGDQSTYTFLLAGGASAASIDTVNAGKAQLAAQAGVDPAAYTADEIVRIRAAQRSGDHQALNFLLSHENRNTVTFPVISRGRNS